MDKVKHFTIEFNLRIQWPYGKYQFGQAVLLVLSLSEVLVNTMFIFQDIARRR